MFMGMLLIHPLAYACITGIHVGCTLYISAWASALLILDGRAMRRPNKRDERHVQIPRFFVYGRLRILVVLGTSINNSRNRPVRELRTYYNCV